MIITDIAKLKEVSTPVISVEEAQEIITKLTEELIKHPHGIGLSAIQIGIPKQVSIIKVNNSFTYLINPVEVEKLDEFVFPNEGCLSLPYLSFYTKRYASYIIKNNIIDNGQFREEEQYYYFSFNREENHDAILAIAVQHEIEHQKGLTLYDVVVKEKPVIKNKKIGRNEPCPCGKKKSDGKPVKYKNCCGK